MSEFTHFDDNGNARMVDVSVKEVTHRKAVASGSIYMSHEALDAIQGRKVKKGDVITVAQTAGIMAVKKTSDIIPMCHSLGMTHAEVDFEMDEEGCSITAICTVSCDDRTGAEMEALTGVSIALLTVYDMCKSIDKRMHMEDIHLVSKSGGKSGDFEY